MIVQYVARNFLIKTSSKRTFSSHLISIVVFVPFHVRCVRPINTKQPPFLNKIQNPGELMSLTFPSFEAPTARISITRVCIRHQLRTLIMRVRSFSSQLQTQIYIINCCRRLLPFLFLFADYL